MREPMEVISAIIGSYRILSVDFTLSMKSNLYDIEDTRSNKRRVQLRGWTHFATVLADIAPANWIAESLNPPGVHPSVTPSQPRSHQPEPPAPSPDHAADVFYCSFWKQIQLDKSFYLRSMFHFLQISFVSKKIVFFFSGRFYNHLFNDTRMLREVEMGRFDLAILDNFFLHGHAYLLPAKLGVKLSTKRI